MRVLSLRVLPSGSELCLCLSPAACCSGRGDTSRCFNKMDKQQPPRPPTLPPVFAYLPHSSSGVLLIWGWAVCRVGEVPLRECESAPPPAHQVNMQANVLLLMFLLLLFHRQGAQLLSTLRAVSQERQFHRPARTSAGKTSCSRLAAD